MSSVDAFGPSSQTLTFNESDELIQGATQGNFQFWKAEHPSKGVRVGVFFCHDLREVF